jgi:Tetratricopeptide repeat
LTELQQARPILERALTIREATLGRDDLIVAECLTALGNVLRELGELGAAIEAHKRALAIREVKLDHDHPGIADNLAGLGLALATEASCMPLAMPTSGHWPSARAD